MPANPWALTPRECDVMDGMMACGVVKAVARRLGIDERTVEWHLDNIALKMQPKHKLAHFMAWHLWRWQTQTMGTVEETVEG